MKTILFILIFSVSLVASIAKVTAVKGEAYLKRTEATSVLTKGMELEQKDIIETLDNARVQILFSDETVITLGKKTLFSVKEYLFDEQNSKADFSVTKGFFKSMTGQIGKIAPEKFKVALKTTTIGIRGTHFMARVDEAEEVIGCTGGIISVTSQGKTIELYAGEMVTVMAGMVPQAPLPLDMKKLQGARESEDVSKIKEKLASLELKDGSITFDKREILAILNDISLIKEADTRRALEDELNDHLNAAFKAGLFELFNKSQASDSYVSGGSATAAYTPLEWGFVTFKDVVDTGDFYSDITEAVPIQTYYELPDGTVPTATSTDIVSTYMGDSTTPHWDGSSGVRKLMTFNGTLIAVSDANTFTSAPEFPVDYDLSKFSAISPDALNNQVAMTVDFGNRLWYGSMKFDMSDTEIFNINFGSIGENALNPTGQRTLYVQYYDSEGKTLPSYDAYLWRYYGENIEQIAGTFNLIRTDGSLVVGSIILNNSGSIDLSAKPAGSTAGFDWGYWAQTNIVPGSELASDPHGAWIAPNVIVVTDSATIDSYISTNVTASYSGEVYGTVHDTVGNTYLMESGAVNLNFDFGAQKVAGSIDFQANSENWGVDFAGAPVSSAGFSFSGSNATAVDLGTINYLEGSGKFYGANADYAGGGFEMGTSDGKFAIGAFAASK